jgi:predicted porin
MRKLLLGSTAIVAIAGLTTAALADVSISATSEFSMSSQESTIAASNGTYNAVDSEVHFKFSTQTDNGLTVGYTTSLLSDADAGGTAAGTNIDESYITISGGFGKLVLGGVDSVGGTFAVTGDDLVAEESKAGVGTSATISTNADLAIGINDNIKVSYYMPAIGGFNAGVSFEDMGAAATANTQTDITTFGASYSMDLGGIALTATAAKALQETAVGSSDNEANNTAIKMVRGPLSIIASNGTYVSGAVENRSSSSVGISYKIDDAMTVAAFSNNNTDTADGAEAYDVSGAELQYVIAAGLTAVINYEDFSYVDGTGGASNTGGADSGSATKFTIKAAF